MRDDQDEIVYVRLNQLNHLWKRTPRMTPDQIFRNEFTNNLGTDWIAVNAQGTPICRADNRASVEHAAPDAEAYFTGADLEPPASLSKAEAKAAAKAEAAAAEPAPSPIAAIDNSAPSSIVSKND